MEDTIEKEFGHVVNNVQIKSQYEKLRGEYNSLKDILFKQIGLGWDEATQTIRADASWWDSLIVARLCLLYLHCAASYNYLNTNVSNT